MPIVAFFLCNSLGSAMVMAYEVSYQDMPEDCFRTIRFDPDQKTIVDSETLLDVINIEGDLVNVMFVQLNNGIRGYTIRKAPLVG